MEDDTGHEIFTKLGFDLVDQDDFDYGENQEDAEDYYSIEVDRHCIGTLEYLDGLVRCLENRDPNQFTWNGDCFVFNFK